MTARKTVATPTGKIWERRVTPPPKAIVSAQKGAGTAAIALGGVLATTILMWLAMPSNVETLLGNFPIPPIYVPLAVSLISGVAKFGWDYLSRKVKNARETREAQR